MSKVKTDIRNSTTATSSNISKEQRDINEFISEVETLLVSPTQPSNSVTTTVSFDPLWKTLLMDDVKVEADGQGWTSIGRFFKIVSDFPTPTLNNQYSIITNNGQTAICHSRMDVVKKTIQDLQSDKIKR